MYIIFHSHPNSKTWVQCKALAAVIFGNPDNITPIPVTATDRFQQLNDRSVDVLLSLVTHTVEREIREVRGTYLTYFLWALFIHLNVQYFLLAEIYRSWLYVFKCIFL